MDSTVTNLLLFLHLLASDASSSQLNITSPAQLKLSLSILSCAPWKPFSQLRSSASPDSTRFGTYYASDTVLSTLCLKSFNLHNDPMRQILFLPYYG